MIADVSFQQVISMPSLGTLPRTSTQTTLQNGLKDCLKEPENHPKLDISSEEVKAQLPVPGPERLPYKVWKAVDPNGTLLEWIFEICRRERMIPSA